MNEPDSGGSPNGGHSDEPRADDAAFDLVQAIDAGRWTGFQIAIFGLGTLAFFVEGFTNQLLGLVIPALMHDWELPRNAFTYTSVLGLVGVAVGNAWGGVVGDKLGRKAGVVGPIFFYGVMDMAAALVHGLPTLALVRFLAGLGLGAMVPNAVALVAEFTPARRRARAVGTAILALPFGSGFAGYVGSYVLPHYGWRMMFIAGGLVPIAFAVLFFAILPETPSYLARDPAKRARLAALLARMHIALPAGALLSEALPKAGKRGLRASFVPGLARDTFCLWGITYFTYMACYTFLTWGPAMLTGAGLDLRLSSLSFTAWSVGGIGSVLIGFSIEFYGSRKTLLAFASLATLNGILLSMLPLVPSQIMYFYAALALEGVCITAIMSSGNVLGAYLYPADCRTSGLGAASGMGRVGAITGVVLGSISLHLGGSVGYFLFMAGATCISLLFVLALRNHVRPAERQT